VIFAIIAIMEITVDINTVNIVRNAIGMIFFIVSNVILAMRVRFKIISTVKFAKSVIKAQKKIINIVKYAKNAITNILNLVYY